MCFDNSVIHLSNNSVASIAMEFAKFTLYIFSGLCVLYINITLKKLISRRAVLGSRLVWFSMGVGCCRGAGFRAEGVVSCRLH